jgi:ATP-dependent DNA ligase
MIIHDGQNIPPFPKIRGELANIRYPCYLEEKLDGEANVYYNNHLISKSSGKIRTGFPVTNHLNTMFQGDIVILGELYWEEGKFGALYKFLSNQKSDKLKFGIFDCITKELDGKPYEERREWLLERFTPLLIHDVPYCHIIPTEYCENEAQLRNTIVRNKTDGYEGLVAKNSDSILTSNGKIIETQTGWVKLKHKFTDDLELVELDPVLERGEVLYKGIRVGVKIVNKYKKLVKVGDKLEIEHQGVLTGGSLRHPVFRGKIVWKDCARVKFYNRRFKCYIMSEKQY